MKRFRPDFYATSIFDIPVRFFREQGIRCVLSDLDNTLDAYDVLVPSERVVRLKRQLEQAGIELCIVSNNRRSRKGIYCERLGVRGIFSCRKPFAAKISAFVRESGYNTHEVLLIGDQLLTDVGCAYHGRLRVVLTEPIVKRDQWTTRFNRLIDRPIRRRLRKKGILEGVKIHDGR